MEARPIPMLVGTAITGQATSPPITLGSAPSIPAQTTHTFASAMRSRADISRCKPATPTSKIASTSFPIVCAVSWASSATGISLVPAHATMIFPLPVCFRSPQIRTTLDARKMFGCREAGEQARSGLFCGAGNQHVRRPLRQARGDFDDLLGKLPSPKITSGAPWRSAR